MEKLKVDKISLQSSRELASLRVTESGGMNRLKAHGNGWALKKPLVFPVTL